MDKKTMNKIVNQFKNKIKDNCDPDNEKLKEIMKLIEEYNYEKDYDKEEEWQSCAGFKIDKSPEWTYTLYMCGGCAQWYNYIIIGTTGAVYKESAEGRKLLRDAVVYTDEDGEYVLIGNKDYEIENGEINLSDFVCQELDWD